LEGTWQAASTVLEVMERERGTENVITMAGYSEQAQWYNSPKGADKNKLSRSATTNT